MPEFSLLDALAGLSKTDLGEVLPDGLYPMRVIECSYAQSAKKGTPGWTYKAEITDGEFKGETLEGTAWFSQTKGGLSLFWQQMQALGVTVEWMQATRATNDQVAEAIRGARFMGSVGVETPAPGQQGRVRNRLIAQTAITDEFAGADGGQPESDVNESGDVLVDDLFTGAGEDVAAEPDPGADNPDAPGPDGSAGEPATPLFAAAEDDEDDPWK